MSASGRKFLIARTEHRLIAISISSPAHLLDGVGDRHDLLAGFRDRAMLGRRTTSASLRDKRAFFPARL
jgi:hypothetical protein